VSQLFCMVLYMLDIPISYSSQPAVGSRDSRVARVVAS